MELRAFFLLKNSVYSRNIDIYGDILRYMKWHQTTIPNFIVFYISFVWDDFSDQETRFRRDEETSIIQQIILYRMDPEFSIGLRRLMKK